MQNLYIAMFVFSSYGIIAQSINYKVLDANHLKASLSSDGTLFSGLNDYAFVGPDITGNEGETIGYNALWIGAKDDQNNLFVSENRYVEKSMTFGFLDTETGQTSDEEKLSQNRVWKIEREDVLKLIEQFEDDNIIDISKDIIEWPARGNPYYGTLLENKDAAPFHDANEDYRYNPMDGDYPTIGPDQGNILPEQILLSVSNDSAIKFDDLNLDIITMIYAFSCEDMLNINRTIFQKQIIYNRSTRDYKAVKIGHFIDAYNLLVDSPENFGSVPDDDLFYYYSDLDQFSSSVAPGRFSHPPVHVCKVLNGELSKFMYYSRPDVAPAGLPPFNIYISEDIYEFLNGYWPNETPMTLGGLGYNPESTEITNFAFSGDPNDPDSWASINLETEFIDVRVLAVQDFNDLPSNNSVTVSLMHVFFQDEQYDNLESVDLAIAGSLDVEDFYNSGFTTDCEQIPTSGIDEKRTSIEISIYPNPSSQGIEIRSDASLRRYRLLDTNGNEVQRGNLLDDSAIQFNAVKQGLYVLELQLTSQQLHYERIVVTH